MFEFQYGRIEQVLCHSFNKKVLEEIGDNSWYPTTSYFWSDEDVLQALTEGRVSTEGLSISIERETQHREIKYSDGLPNILGRGPGEINGFVYVGSRVSITDVQGNTILDHFFESQADESTY